MTNSEVINNIMCMVYRTFISNKCNAVCRIHVMHAQARKKELSKAAA